MARSWLIAFFAAFSLAGCTALEQFPEVSVDYRADLWTDDRDYAMFLTKLFGWSFRGANWYRHRLRDAARLALICGTSMVRQLNRGLNRLQRHRPRFLPTISTSSDPTATEDFHRSLMELRNHWAIDPVLCFERQSHPGVLWIEAHWYIGIDGKKYIHF